MQAAYAARAPGVKKSEPVSTQERPPMMKQNMTVSQSVDHAPSGVWVMSPDYRQGIIQQVPFTYSGGVATFELPYLEYWDMVVIQ